MSEVCQERFALTTFRLLRSKSKVNELAPYLNLMAKRPLALKYTSFYSQLPTEWQSYFEACTVPEKQEALKLLAIVLKDDNFVFGDPILTEAVIDRLIIIRI